MPKHYDLGKFLDLHIFASVADRRRRHFHFGVSRRGFDSMSVESVRFEPVKSVVRGGDRGKGRAGGSGSSAGSEGGGGSGGSGGIGFGSVFRGNRFLKSFSNWNQLAVRVLKRPKSFEIGNRAAGRETNCQNDMM